MVRRRYRDAVGDDGGTLEVNICEPVGVDHAVGYVEQETADRSYCGRRSDWEDRGVHNTGTITTGGVASCIATSGCAVIDTM